MDTDIERFKDLAFLFACDKLDPTQTAWMHAMLAQHPQWQAEVDADRHWVSQTRGELARQRAESPPLVSLETVMAAGPAHRPHAAALLSVWFARWWHARLPVPWTVGVGGFAVALTVLIMPLASNHEEQAVLYRGTEQKLSQGPLLKVVFDDRITLKQWRALLDEQHLRVVRGPDQQGILWLSPGDGDAERALAALHASAVVLDAQIVAGTP